ncbi:Vegetative incompatibility protein HET-E-1 [Colletotrichum siamense]|uniref:Vegetative incompatibility protein HET-E-1 n=1 Tax=Colletotrichum siamense TaxID=690259 RepID=UPI0018724E93|nr:Vegetative incompatibility protein HET-E-1 [Colletotrichum siamense]KAF5487532.1 Vegetative incompatibility protein HET-E-1 [Colletotrichum siamense]
MRLVNARSLQLEEFFGEGIPKYAILSHTWTEGQEVTFQEFSAQKARNKSGWTKIERTTQLALEDKLHHVWIDTCCIDKTSSAELTEAINSMMSWYERSQVCYTYLEDVPSGLGVDARENVFRNSRWFTRGWTLQELLAPSKLAFIFSDWTRFATRNQMANLVSSISGIEASFLRTPEGQKNNKNFPATDTSTAIRVSRRTSLYSASIAQRMSWASNRRTTRVEDIAYCLLGIFDINMPLLYGEGSKAFLRLQEQILMSSDDQYILAWNFEGLKTEQSGADGEDWFSDYYLGNPEFAGLVATSPSVFSTCQSIERINIGKPTLHSLITNKGLRLELAIGPSEAYPRAFLQCQDKCAPASVVALSLMLTDEGFYVRARLPLVLVDYQLLLKFRPTELYALEYGEYAMRRETGRDYTIMIRNLPEDIKILHAWGENGNMERDSEIILQSDGRDDKLTGGALLLGDQISVKSRLILVVVSQRQSAKSYDWPCPLEMSGLIDLDRLEDQWPGIWDSTRPLKSENLSRILEEAKRTHFDQWPDCGIMPTIYTAYGVFSTRVDVQDCFGKPVIFVDVSLKLRQHVDIRSLPRQLPWWLRYYMRGHSGVNRVMLLLVLAPRVCTIVIELLARKAAKIFKATAYPWYMVPLMTDYVFLPAGDPPLFLASTLATARKETLQTLKRRAAISLLAYLSCKLIGSDTVLERFKKFLASKK